MDVYTSPIAENRSFRDVPYALFCFALYLFIYGFLIFRFGMHQDEILDYDGRALGTYVGAGRWMLGIWRLLLPGGYLPFSGGLIAGLFISLTLVCQTKILGFTEKLPRLVYACFYLGCIQFAWMLYYSFLSDALALGFLLCTGSVFSYLRGHRLLSVICMAFAIGVYQTNVLYMGVLFAAVLWRQSSECRVGRLCAGFAFCVLAALALWKVIAIVSCHFPWVSESQIQYQITYQRGMFLWGYLKEQNMAFLFIVFGHLLLEAGKNLLGLTYDGQWVYATTLLPVSFLAWKALREARVVVKCRKLLLLTVIWTLPFGFLVIMGTQQGPRTDLAEPLACALLWVLAISHFDFSDNYRGKVVCYVLLGMLVLKSSVRVSVMARDEMYGFREAAATLHAIETCGIMLANHEGVDIERILLVGSPKPGSPRPQAYLGSAPTWYLNYIKSPFLVTAQESDIAPHREILEEMPAWPAPGSIRLHAGEVVVRIAPNPAHPVPDRVWRDRAANVGRFRSREVPIAEP